MMKSAGLLMLLCLGCNVGGEKEPGPPPDTIESTQTGTAPAVESEYGNEVIDGRSPGLHSLDMQARAIDSILASNSSRPPIGQSGSADESIDGLIWQGDAASIEVVLGDVNSRMREGAFAPEAIFSNRAKDQFLQMIATYGGGQNQMRMFIVGRIADLDSVPEIFPSVLDSFRTEHGVHLGMTMSSLMAIKGRPLRRMSTRRFRDNTILRMTPSSGVSILDYHDTLDRHDYREYGDKKQSTEVLLYLDRKYDERYVAEYFFDSRKRLVKFAFGLIPV
jgi:hypothetical protein